MKKISTLTLLSLLLLIAQNLFSVPAVPWPVEKQLPDGSIVSVYLKGDEKVHWMESMDGYTLLYNDSRNIVYAEKDVDGNLVPSQTLYGIANPPAEDVRFISSLSKGLRYSSAQVDMLMQIWAVEESAVAKSSPAKSSVIGDKKALCILMNFTNKSMGKTKEQFENLMNQVGFVNETGAVGSVKDFYRENSYSKMDLTVTVVGPYNATGSTSYYGSNQYRWLDFAREAVIAADADVNYADFANANNVLETVHIIFAGYGDEAVQSGQQIWSHKSELFPSETLDGVTVSVYSCSPELRNGYGSTLTGIGVICHELCHVFGSDDYYDTDYASSGGPYLATGEWDLMAEGSWNSDGDVPAHINMFQKILYEWVEPIELTEPIAIVDMPNSAENPVAYIVKPYTNNEQYVLENRQQVGFDAKVPGKGLLIYHIHNSAASGSINNRSHPQRAYVVAANSSVAIPTSVVSTYGNINSSRAPFASTASLNEFSKETAPAMFRWNNSTGTTSGVLDKPLTNITQTAGLISFDFMGGQPTPCQPVQNLAGELVENILDLTWEKPEETEEYGEIAFTYSVYMNDELLIEGLEATQYTITLPGYGNYNCCVIAVSEEQECESAPACYLAEYPNPCASVTGFTLKQEGKDVITAWVAPVPGEGLTIDHYELYRDETLIATLQPAETEYTDEHPAPDTYIYSILTYYTPEGVSDPISKEIEVLLFDECAQLPNVTPTLDNNNLTLKWDKIYHILSYDVYRDGELIAEAITDTSYTDVLTESSPYVYGIVSNGEECQSEPKNVTVSFTSVCDRVNIIDFVITQEADHIRLDWELEVSGKNVTDPIIPYYNVYENGELIAEAIEDKFFEKELTKSGEYTFEVSFVDYCETEPVGETINFTHTDIDKVNADSGVKIYPTVTGGKLTVETPSAARIVLKDITGRTLNTYHSAGKLDITLDYSSGVYLVTVECADKATTSKIILK